MNLKKIPSVEKILEEYSQSLDSIGKAKQGLSPYWMSDIDGVIENQIKSKVSSKDYKYFESCQFHFKALWYIYTRIQEWDEKYRNLISLCVNEKRFDEFQELSGEFGYKYSYFPFFEALEFKNMLTYGNSCLDTFSKAMGVFFKESPRNLKALEKILQSKAANNEKARILLKIVEKASEDLTGLILDPQKKGKKSLRDLLVRLSLTSTKA